MTVSLADRALCDTDDVKRLVPGFTDFDEPTEEALIEQINEQSDGIHASTGREFKPITPGSSTRLFDLTCWHQRERHVRIGDTAAITLVQVQLLDGTVQETVAAASRVSMPRVRQDWEPITQLWFPRSDVPAPVTTLAAGRVLAVTATWGFPAIPDRLRLACAKLALYRYITDVATETETALAEAAAELNLAGMFAQATTVVRGFARPGFA